MRDPPRRQTIGSTNLDNPPSANDTDTPSEQLPSTSSRACFGRVRANLAEFWRTPPKSGRIPGSNRAEFGTDSIEFGRRRTSSSPNSEQLWPVDICPNLGKLGPHSTNIDPKCADSGQSCFNLAEAGPNVIDLGQAWPGSDVPNCSE